MAAARLRQAALLQPPCLPLHDLEDLASGHTPLDPDTLQRLEATAAAWSRDLAAAAGTSPDADFMPASTSGLSYGDNQRTPRPGALAELDFWTAHAASLAALTAQMSDRPFQLVTGLLQRAGSGSATAALQRSASSVAVALQEAQSNAKYTRPLRPLLQRLAAADGDFAVSFTKCEIKGILMCRLHRNQAWMVMMHSLRSALPDLHSPFLLSPLCRPFPTCWPLCCTPCCSPGATPPTTAPLPELQAWCGG